MIVFFRKKKLNKHHFQIHHSAHAEGSCISKVSLRFMIKGINLVSFYAVKEVELLEGSERLEIIDGKGSKFVFLSHLLYTWQLL